MRVRVGLWAVLMIAVVAAAAGWGGQESASVHDLPEVEVDDPLDRSPTVTIAPDVEGAAEGAAEVPVVLDVQWSFRPQLDDGEFRFRDADGRHEAVALDLTWTDATGAPIEVGDVVLRLHGDDADMRLDGMTQNGSARFLLEPSVLLAPGGSTVEWLLSTQQPNSTVWHTYGGAGAETDALEAQAGTPVKVHDDDEDGVPDDLDNCPALPNPDQKNLDGDLQGDACDDDRDGDGHGNDEESWARSDPDDHRSTPDDPDADGFDKDEEQAARSDPFDADSTPQDPDADGYRSGWEDRAGSDPFDPASTPRDIDADGHENEQDNCPDEPNRAQADGDADGIGDACDEQPDDGPDGDADADGTPNAGDNCPTIPNDQDDLDGDGAGDICDTDRDGDGVHNAPDAFPDDATEWRDTDGDGTGDVADQDDDGDGLSDAAEADLGTNPRRADTDADGLEDFAEIQDGTDPLDRFDPDMRATGVRAVADEQVVTIRWEAPHDERVDRYIVWRGSPLAKVAEVTARPDGAYAVTDAGAPLDDQQYGVQVVLDDQDGERDPDATVTTAVYREQLLEAGYEAPGEPVEERIEERAEDTEGTPEVEETQAPLAPAGEEAPLPVAVLLLALLVAVRRKR